MHSGNHICCGHVRSESLAVDPRFADDEFTQDAVSERRMRAAHAHGTSLIFAILGGILLVGVAKKVFGCGR